MRTYTSCSPQDAARPQEAAKQKAEDGPEARQPETSTITSTKNHRKSHPGCEYARSDKQQTFFVVIDVLPNGDFWFF